MTDNWKIGIVAVMIMSAIVSGCIFLALRDNITFGECVLVSPREADSGSISDSGQVFRLDYSGTTKGTGEPCSITSLVTVFEYDRMMYGSGQ